MLKTLMLRRKIDLKKAELAKLREKSADFETREAELETAIDEVATEEEQAAVDAEIESFNAEKKEHEDALSSLEAEVEKLEGELAAEEAAQRAAQAASQQRTAENAAAVESNHGGVTMDTRKTKFFGMTVQERDAFVAREDVKEWLQHVRDMGKIAHTRGISGGSLLIPDVVLDLLRQNLEDYSKLYRRVNLQRVPGTARQNIMGAMPEAVWTEMCANINELAIEFVDAEVDGYKVGGFIPVCKALLEDNDVALAQQIIITLGQAIGLALDKAILYGTGTKMPKGIVPRLVQISDPSDPAISRDWVDLHSTNVKTISSTGVTLFKDIVNYSAAASGKYSRGAKTWVMNEKTYAFLLAEAMSVNASGAIVSGVNGTMPVIGGDLVVLDFMPDNVIVGGYFDLYLLAERAGSEVLRSDEARFLQDQVVFKGTARYDGLPVIAEGFVALGVKSTTPGGFDVTFAGDAANTVTGILLPTTATVAAGSAIQLSAVLTPAGAKGTVTYTSATTAKATVNSTTGVVTGVASGSSVITATCGGYAATCTVTVTA